MMLAKSFKAVAALVCRHSETGFLGIRRNMSDNGRKCRVLLHVHLDGSVRPATIFELAKKKGIKVPGKDGKDLGDILALKKQSTLDQFLQVFGHFMPVLQGDLDAIKRVTYEFCEDCARQKVLYVEARYSPHFLADPEGKSPSTRDVIHAVNESLKKGSKDFGITAKSILCCIRTIPDWSKEILELCQEFKNDGVVGMDLAGNEQLSDEEPTQLEHVRVFQEAQRLGINRTVHAGENGPAACVDEALNKMHAQRIGHGYHSIDDSKVYQQVKDKNVHLEVCPISSWLTGSVDHDYSKHPAIQFAKDKINYSFSTDDTVVTGKFLDDDYNIVMSKMGIGIDEINRTNICAAKSCFLPEEEKKALVKELEEIYGKA